MLCDVVTGQAWCRPGEERQKSGGLVPGMGSIRQPSHSAGGSRAPAPPTGEEYRLTFYSCCKTIHRFHSWFSQSGKMPLLGQGVLRDCTTSPIDRLQHYVLHSTSSAFLPRSLTWPSLLNSENMQMQLTPISSCLVCLCFNQRPKILRLLSRLHRFVLGLSLLLSLLLSYYEPLAQVPPSVLKLISDPGSHLRKLFSSRHQFNFPQQMKSRRVSTLLRRPWLPPRLPPPITKIHTNGCERC